MAAIKAEEHYDISIEFKLSASVHREPLDGDFVHEISGKFLATFNEGERTEPAGALSATLVQFDEAMENQIHPERLGDGISGALAFYWEVLFDVITGDLKPEIRSKYDVEGCNLLIIDSIQVYPKFRGHGIGFRVVDRAIEIFGHSCALVALKPQPLQFTPYFSDRRTRLKQLQAPGVSEAQAIRKLSRYWSRAGFKPFGKSGIFLKSPRLQSIDSLRIQRWINNATNFQTV